MGRLVVHGLATVSLMTRVGGAMGFMARRFDMEFLKPVFSGDCVRCTVTLTEMEAADAAALGSATKRPATRVTATASLVNARSGVEVARVVSRGIIPRPFAEVAADDPRSRL